MIRVLAQDSAGIHAVDPSPEAVRPWLDNHESVMWVDLKEPTAAEAEPILGAFGFHPLAIEDALGHVEHPKIDDYGTYLYVVMQGIDLCSNDELQVQEIDFFLGANYLVTVHHAPVHCIETMWERAMRDGRFLQRGADGLAHAVIDLLVDDLMPVLDSLDATIEQLEDRILANPSHDVLARTMDIKRATLRLRRTVVPQREVAYRLSRDESELVRPKTRLYFRDVYDHLVRVVDINEALRDVVAGALEIYLTVVSNRMNEVIKVLTLVTTICMPITLVTGLYGMNFRFMPELEWRYGYLVAIAVMLVMTAGMAWWFRRRGWM